MLFVSIGSLTRGVQFFLRNNGFTKEPAVRATTQVSSHQWTCRSRGVVQKWIMRHNAGSDPMHLPVPRGCTFRVQIERPLDCCERGETEISFRFARNRYSGRFGLILGIWNHVGWEMGGRSLFVCVILLTSVGEKPWPAICGFLRINPCYYRR